MNPSINIGTRRKILAITRQNFSFLNKQIHTYLPPSRAKQMMAYNPGGNNCQFGGQQRAYHCNNPPCYNETCDVQNRYSQQCVENRNDIYVNQPIINNRNHFVNNINSQIVRDNNYYHYNQQNLARDNFINRYFNQVYRTSCSYADYSCTSGTLPGMCSNINMGTVFCGCIC